MNDDPFHRDPDIQAAADYATEIHIRDARRGYAKTGLSEHAIEELISAGFLKPHWLTDGTLTEAPCSASLVTRHFARYRRSADSLRGVD